MELKLKQYRPLELAMHEFHVALRRLGREINFMEMYIKFHHEQDKEFSNIAKYSGFICITFATIFSSGQNVSVSLPFFNIQISKIFIILVFSASIAFISFMIVNVICLFYITKYLERRISKLSISTAIFDSIVAHSVNWSFAFPAMASSMFRIENEGGSRRHRIVSGLVIIPAFTLIVCMIFLTWVTSWTFIIDKNTNLIELVCAFSSIILSSTPFVFIYVLIFPINITKDVSFVRWNFLAKIYSREEMLHPQFEKWRKQHPRDV